MELFISGEVTEGAAEGLQNASIAIMDLANPILGARNYGKGIKIWYFLPIILPEPVLGFNEVQRYNKKSKYVEFKKFIDYNAFVNASHGQQCGLIVHGLLQSIDEAKSMHISNMDFDELERDILHIRQVNNW